MRSLSDMADTDMVRVRRERDDLRAIVRRYASEWVVGMIESGPADARVTTPVWECVEDHEFDGYPRPSEPLSPGEVAAYKNALMVSD